MSSLQRSLQQPVHSGFGASSTAAQVVAGQDLDGKVAIVTGGYAGIGLETTRALVAAGATVVVPARSADKAREALAGLPRVEQGSMDLLDPASIDAFAQAYIASGRPLHLLIDNAGIMATPLVRDARGYESQFAANHLGHFQLAARLWPALVKAGGARVVSVSSRGHRRSGVDFDDPNFERRPYEKWTAYGQAKTANVLFAVALDRRGRQHDVRAFAVHPGGIITDLIRHLSDEELAPMGVVRDAQGRFTRADSAEVFKTVEQGAATSIWCATSPQLTGLGGVYCEDCDIAMPVAADDPNPNGVRPWAIDADAAERLWTMSEKLVGIRFAT